MKVKIVIVFVGAIGLAVWAGLALTKQAAKEKPAPEGMVFVPAGEFIMGISKDDSRNWCRNYYEVDKDRCNNNWNFLATPDHKVYLDAFYIDKHEVTNADYQKCVKAGKCQDHYKDGSCYVGDGWKMKQGGRIDPVFLKSDHPVVCIGWEDARSYCSWAGKRLPTEAEWEKAARGTDGRIYPWGNEFDDKKVNFCDKRCQPKAPNPSNDGYKYTAPVGSYPAGASPYGALDMAGNVSEWTADWLNNSYYEYGKGRDKNPQGPDTGSYRVYRGGDWFSFTPELRAVNRGSREPEDRINMIGVRCACD